MRTYSFDHFKADKPEPSTAYQGGAEQTPPVEQARPSTEDKELHYGRQHAQTAELYRKHREERELTEQMRVSGPPVEPMGGEAPPEEPLLQDKFRDKLRGKADVEATRALAPDEAGRERLEELSWQAREMAWQAVSSLLAATREAVRGHPLTGARKLAGDALSGVRRIAREVSARTSRSTRDEQRSAEKKEEKKGPGKKR